MMKFKSRACEAIHEAASDLHSVGAISDNEMEDFNNSCLVRNEYFAESFVSDLSDTRKFESDRDAKNFYTKMYGEDFCIYRNNKMIYCSRLNVMGAQIKTWITNDEIKEISKVKRETVLGLSSIDSDVICR